MSRDQEFCDFLDRWCNKQTSIEPRQHRRGGLSSSLTFVKLMMLLSTLSLSHMRLVTYVGNVGVSEMSDCRTLPSDTLTSSDTTYRPRLSESMSDECRTVSDCRSVGSVGNVGIMSDLCRKVCRKCRTGAQGPRPVTRGDPRE